MIICVCARCGRKHESEALHEGLMLRCAGCGDPVLIGRSDTRNQRKRVIEGEVVAWNKKHAQVTRRWRRIPRYAYVGAILVICFLCISVLLISDIKEEEPRVRSIGTSPILESKKKTSPAGPTVPLSNRQPRLVSPRPATGTSIVRTASMSGRGRFSFENGNDGDAVILLISDRTKRVVRSIYVRSGDEGTMRNIAPGTYWVKVATGRDWDSERRGFELSSSFYRVSHSYSFTETAEENGVVYSTVKLTLYRVFNGNVEQEPISSEDFWTN